jgi:hypothetical protein
LKAAPIVVCARTSLAVPPSGRRARSAIACALRPHATWWWRARWLAAHERREGLCARTAMGGDLGAGARMKAGDACDVLQTPWLLRWQHSIAAGGAMVSVVSTVTREGNSTRTDSRAAPATLRLHLDVSILRQAQDHYVAKNAFASATETTDNVARPLLKNRVLTSSMNTWPPLAGCLLTGRREDDRHWLIPPSTTATISRTVLGTAPGALAPRLATPTQSHGLTYALLPPETP